MANKLTNVLGRLAAGGITGAAAGYAQDVVGQKLYDASQNSESEFVKRAAGIGSKLLEPGRRFRSTIDGISSEFGEIGSNIKDRLTGASNTPGYENRKKDINFGEAIVQGFQEGAYDYQAPSIEESSTSSPAGYGKYLEESLTNINQVSGRRNSYIAQKSNKMFGPNKYRNQ